MKKPTYLKFEFPIDKKGTIASAVKKYFNRLENKVLQINYGKDRFKKYFKYRVINAGVEERYSWPEYDEKKIIVLEIELVADLEQSTITPSK